MKKLERLLVKVTYEVDLSDVEVPDEASEWLSRNIFESDAWTWEYEIEDLITEED